jgi:hypothetical protein
MGAARAHPSFEGERASTIAALALFSRRLVATAADALSPPSPNGPLGPKEMVVME